MDTYEFLTAADKMLIQTSHSTRRSNRRLDERLNAELHVALRISNKLTVQGRATNISSHGIFIEAPVDLLPYEGQIELRSYHGDVVLAAVGDIVHKTAVGIGVCLRAPIMAYELVEGGQYAIDPIAIAI